MAEDEILSALRKGGVTPEANFLYEMRYGWEIPRQNYQFLPDTHLHVTGFSENWYVQGHADDQKACVYQC